MGTEILSTPWRRTSVVAAVALAMPAVSHGLGLGRAIGEPVLGEALRVEIPLTGTLDRPLDIECVSLRRPSESIDADYFPRDLAARIDKSSGASRLLLTTQAAVRQPLVEFRVSVSCGYNLSHDYLLMASPRVEAPPPVSPVLPPVAAAAPKKAEAPATRASAPATAEAPVAAGSGAALPDGLPARNLVLDQDMTLEQLARAHFPGPLRQGRFMRWVVEANPAQFAGAGKLRKHQLRKGTQLLIPEGVPPRRPGDYKDGKTPLGEPMDAAPAEPPAAPRKAAKPASAGEAPPPGRAPADGGKDRLVVGNSAGAAKDVKETVALVERLTGMMEQQLSAQGANDEKIKQLEAKVAELGRTVETLEADGRQREARWQAERLAERAAREQEADRGWWQLLLAVAVGGIVGAGLLHAARLFLRRGERPAAADDSAAGNSAADVAAAVGPADSESGPLTEFGWDEEPRSVRGKAASAAAAPTPAVAPAPIGRPAAAPTPVAAPAIPVRAAGAVDTGLEARQARTEPMPSIQFEPPNAAATPGPAAEDVPSDPAQATIELANIMTAMGLTDSAARTLVEHISENPRDSLEHWLKLLELYRLSGNRQGFERSVEDMRQHFNVQADQWIAKDAPGRASLEDFPHLRSQLVRQWGQPEARDFLQCLLMDNREGTRAGFPITVVEEILLLLAMLNSPQ